MRFVLLNSHTFLNASSLEYFFLYLLTVMMNIKPNFPFNNVRKRESDVRTTVIIPALIYYYIYTHQQCYTYISLLLWVFVSGIQSERPETRKSIYFNELLIERYFFFLFLWCMYWNDIKIVNLNVCRSFHVEFLVCRYKLDWRFHFKRFFLKSLKILLEMIKIIFQQNQINEIWP